MLLRNSKGFKILVRKSPSGRPRKEEENDITNAGKEARFTDGRRVELAENRVG